MLNVSHGREIVISVDNDPTGLLNVARLLADHGLNVISLNGDFAGEGWAMRLITDDPLRTEDVLRKEGYRPSAETVVLLKAPHKAGMLKRIALRLAEDGVSLKRIHAAATDGQAMCLIVMRTSNDDRALVCLSEFIVE
jgi:hypothetical protein